MRGLTLAQLADRYGKSKQCVSDKIKTSFTQQQKDTFITTRKNRQYVSTQGVNILDQLMHYQDIKEPPQTPQNAYTSPETIQVIQQPIQADNAMQLLDVIEEKYVSKSSLMQIASEYKLDKQTQSYTDKSMQEQINNLKRQNQELRLVFIIALIGIIIILFVLSQR